MCYHHDKYIVAKWHYHAASAELYRCRLQGDAVQIQRAENAVTRTLRELWERQSRLQCEHPVPPANITYEQFLSMQPEYVKNRRIVW